MYVRSIGTLSHPLSKSTYSFYKAQQKLKKWVWVNNSLLDVNNNGIFNGVLKSGVVRWGRIVHRTKYKDASKILRMIVQAISLLFPQGKNK